MALYRCVLIGLVLFGTIHPLWSQDTILPKGMSTGELRSILDHGWVHGPASAQCLATPPPPGIRPFAEWEEQQSVAITWGAFPEILSQIVAALQPDTEVLIICADSNAVCQYLEQQKINCKSNIRYLIAPYNSIWIRDYGPNTIYVQSSGALALVDWMYNRPRPKDDKISEYIAQNLDLPLYCTNIAPNDLVHTGGNHITDGSFASFASTLLLEENEPGNIFGVSAKSIGQINQILNRYQGTPLLHLASTLPYDEIHHLDMHFKLLDEYTIMVGEYPEGVADGPQIEANLSFLKNNCLAKDLQPYRIIRMPMPPDARGNFPDNGGHYRTYVNALIANKTVLVPTYEEQYDTTALRIWAEAMPGYKIVGINCNNIIPYFGALHCITREIGSADAIHFDINRMNELCDQTHFFTNATANHHSGIKSLEFRYRRSIDSTWTRVPLNTSNQKDFLLYLPPLPVGEYLAYYHATANNGHEWSKPCPGIRTGIAFEVKQCTPTAINAPLIPPKLELFPNPVTTEAVLHIQRPFVTTWEKIVVVDAYGQPLKVLREGPAESGETNLSWSMKGIPQGQYFVVYQSANVLLRIPLIKAN